MACETYKFINDETTLKDFIDWLPKLEKEEGYYYILLARKKYDKTNTIKTNQTCIKRGITSKEFLMDTLKSLEIKKGLYKLNNDILDESILSLYIHPNPRSFKKSAVEFSHQILNTIVNNEEMQNPKSMILSQLAKYPSRKIFVDVDIDLQPDQTMEIDELELLIKNRINKEAIENIITTRGGFHLLIRPDLVSKEYTSTYHKSISSIKGKKIKDVSIKHDRLMPIPGTIQGGFVPKMTWSKK